MRYFHAANAGRVYAGVLFTKYAQEAGTWLGVAEVDGKEAEGLAALIGKTSVTEINKVEYDECIKKKSPDLEAWQPRQVAQPALVSGPSIKTPTAVLVENPTPAADAETPVEIGKPVASVDDALATGPVEKPPTPEPVPLTKAEKQRNFKK